MNLSVLQTSLSESRGWSAGCCALSLWLSQALGVSIQFKEISHAEITAAV